MGIQNGRGITSLPQYPDAAVPGTPWGPGRDVPYVNPMLPQVSTCTWSAVSDVSDEIVAGQVIRTTITDPDGVAYVTDYTVTADDNTAGTDGAGLALMAQRQAESLNANAELANIVSASNSGAVCTVTWLHPDQGEWTFAATVVPAAAETTLVTTEATSQTAGGTAIPMARFVRHNGSSQGNRRASLPSGSTDMIAGIALRDPTQTRLYDTSADAVDSYPIGTMMSVREQGAVPMINRGGTAALAGGPVYCVISTSGGNALGEARSDPDGTADVWTLTPSAANDAVYGISIHFPAWNGESARTFVVPPVTADGSATATEIVTLLAASIATVTELAALVSVTTGATLVLTGVDLGRPFTVYDSAEAGDFTSITHTTTAAAYTKLVERARWDDPCAVGAIAPVFLGR